eukprot:symbB.v1.2.011192.t2/scaffold714.1/size170141/9
MDLEQFTAGLTESSTPALPPVPSAKPDTEIAEEPQMSPPRTVRQDAAEWVESEESAWSSFAKTTLGEAQGPRTAKQGLDRR